jgi:hypothetical protein
VDRAFCLPEIWHHFADLFNFAGGGLYLFLMSDPTKLIAVFQALLAQLEQTISQMPQLMAEDGRAESLGNQIQAHQTQLARIKNVLRKHQDHEKRKRELETQNRKNNPKR